MQLKAGYPLLNPPALTITTTITSPAACDLPPGLNATVFPAQPQLCACKNRWMKQDCLQPALCTTWGPLVWVQKSNGCVSRAMKSCAFLQHKVAIESASLTVLVYSSMAQYDATIKKKGLPQAHPKKALPQARPNFPQYT